MTQAKACGYVDPWEEDEETPLEEGTAYADGGGADLIRAFICPKCGRELFAVPASLSGTFSGRCYKCKLETVYTIRPTSRKIGFTSDFAEVDARESRKERKALARALFAPPGALNGCEYCPVLTGTRTRGRTHESAHAIYIYTALKS